MNLVFPPVQQDILDKREQLLHSLREVLEPDHIIETPVLLHPFECDAFTNYRKVPMLVVLPGDTAQVSAVMNICHALGVPVVPRGAGTSLTGSATPTEDALVLGISRMNRVLEFDREARAVRVECGISNIKVSEAVGAEGFFYAPDPSSQLACSIAGNIANNSGGAHCLKYGVTTNNLLGVRMVMADGEILDFGGPELEHNGYDILGLLCGSEGQLGVVTEAWLRIIPKPEGALPMMLGFTSNERAGACVARIIESGHIPVAIEFMDKPAIIACDNFAKAGYPLDAEALLIIEVEGAKEEIEAQLARISEIAKEFQPVSQRVATSSEEAAAIWLGRKSAFGAMGQLGDYVCMDGTIPTGALPKVLTQISEMTASYGLRVANIFHAGDGNLHPLILFDANIPGELEKAEMLGADILKICVAAGGCLTGEHGVGLEKRELMTMQFTELDLQYQMMVKSLFDSEWMLNPAKVFPLDLARKFRASRFSRIEAKSSNLNV